MWISTNILHYSYATTNHETKTENTKKKYIGKYFAVNTIYMEKPNPSLPSATIFFLPLLKWATKKVKHKQFYGILYIIDM